MREDDYNAKVAEFFAVCGATTRFTRYAGICRVLSVSEGCVVVEFDVTDDIGNMYGNLQGGATATLVDVCTSAALAATTCPHNGVSVDLHVTYTNTAAIGDTVILKAEVVKWGRRAAFTRAELRRKKDNQVVATGVHTKSLPDDGSTPPTRLKSRL